MANRLTDSGREKVRKELERKALKVVREAKREAPVDTGRLRASITYEMTTGADGLPAAVIGTNVDYAPHVEFGTIYQAPQPFLRLSLNKLKAGQL